MPVELKAYQYPRLKNNTLRCLLVLITYLILVYPVVETCNSCPGALLRLISGRVNEVRGRRDEPRANDWI